MKRSSLHQVEAHMDTRKEAVSNLQQTETCNCVYLGNASGGIKPISRNVCGRAVHSPCRKRGLCEENTHPKSGP